MGGVAIGLVAFFLFLTARLNTTDMSLLYGNLAAEDSAKISARLDSMGVDYELRGEGKQILVPSAKAPSVRMTMAEEGLPSDGSIGYEIFDRSEGLGTTNFVQNVNLLRALEGELGRSIRSLQQVQDARVHLVMPKRELFSRKKQEPSASVVIKTRGSNQLAKTQVLAVQYLVAAAIPGLDPSRISIIDSRGRLLARPGTGEDGGDLLIANNEEIRRNHERRVARTIEELIQQTVGPGKVRAQVSVEMDFDRISTSTETFDPDGQVVRSTQTVEESSSSSESDGESAVTVETNLPDTNVGGFGGKNASRSDRTEETVNYEITKTVKNHVRESGTIRRLSVAVLVDGTYSEDADGNQVYKPRSQEELDKLETLVRSGIGFDAERGDTVELINMQFVDESLGDRELIEPLFGLTKADYFRIGELIVLAIVGILVILLVVRPLISRTLDALPSALESAKEQALLADQSEDLAALAGPPGTGITGPLDDEDNEMMIDIDMVEGRVRASTIRKISEIVERHPEETVGIIRQWMYSEA